MQRKRCSTLLQRLLTGPMALMPAFRPGQPVKMPWLPNPLMSRCHVLCESAVYIDCGGDGISEMIFRELRIVNHLIPKRCSSLHREFGAARTIEDHHNHQNNGIESLSVLRESCPSGRGVAKLRVSKTVDARARIQTKLPLLIGKSLA